MSQRIDEDCQVEIAELAYQKWESRAESHEDPLRDWLEAEADLRQVRGWAKQVSDAESRYSSLVIAYQRTQRWSTVEHAVARILNRSADLADAVPRILKVIGEGMGWDAAVLWLVDRDHGTLGCHEFWHAPWVEVTEFEQASRRSVFPLGIGLPGRIWASQRPTWVADVAVDANFPRAGAALSAGLHAACGFPLRNGAGYLGAIEFFSREVRPPDDELFQTMGSIGCQISQFIERGHAEAGLHSRVEERRLARRIQQGFLPRVMPAQAGFAIGGRMWPADTVSGDCFDFFRLPANGLGILIADASGHGYASALLMAQVRASIQALTLTTADLGAILSLTNRCLGEEADLDYFVTALMVRLDPGTGDLAYVGAGHWPGYLLDSGGDVRAELTSAHLPLGIDPAADLAESGSCSLEPGELLFLLTDGILEACATDDDLFGIDRALGVVRAHRHSTPEEILESLDGTVRDFTGGRNPADDMTAIVIKAEECRLRVPPEP